METIFTQAAAGNRDAIEVLLSDYQGRIESACRKLRGQVAIRADSSDAAQMTLLRIFDSLSAGDWKGRDESEFRAWVYRQARNVCRKLVIAASAKGRDYRREQSRSAGVESDIDVAAADLGVSERAEHNETIEALLSLVSRDVDRALVDGIMAGESFAEIAERAGCEVKLLYGRLKYLKKLASRVRV